MTPTQIVKLWIGNDEGTYQTVRNIAESVWTRTKGDNLKYIGSTRSENARFELADQLKSWLQVNQPGLDGIWEDLLNHAFSEVNWTDLADGYLEQFVEGYIAE